MYDNILTLHSWLRWAVALLAIIAIYKAYDGWLNNKPYTSGDNKVSIFFIASVHSQFLLGLILYIFLSPMTKAAFNDFGTAMKTAPLRFWAVEHIAGMLIGVILAQVGRSLSKKANTDNLKHKKAAIFYTIAIIIILASIPWPFYADPRPLFRF